jgi:hypothetical protein
MPPAQVRERQTMTNLQGIVVPSSSVNAQAFFAATRRLIVPVKTQAYAGLGNSDNISMLQTGILGGISIKFSGTLTVALPTGTCASTMRWPYDLFKAVRFSANGQANLINCSGWHLKLRDIMARGDLNDRGVSRGIGGASPGTTVTQGTLSLNNESWGVGQNVSAIPAATYPVELNLFVPVAYDQLNLLGAIFAQTSATDLNLAIDWAAVSDLFTLTGTATAGLTGTIVVEPVLYSIPQGPNGDVIVPDLSVFHSIIQTRNNSIANGDNEIRLAGQGVGRQLLRLWWRTFSGTVPVALPVNATNYGQCGWRFGSNDTPEVFTDGRHLAYFNERMLGADIASQEGFGLLDWASEHAFRDSIDEGAATELRLLVNIPAGVSLTSPFLEYTQETVFAGAVGA